MNLLTKKEFLVEKNSDTLAIMGSGYSINSITLEEREEIIDCDSIGFNWFCKSGWLVDYYLVREQCTAPSKIESGCSVKDLINQINCKVVIVVDKTGPADNYSHVENLDKFYQDGIVVKNTKAKGGAVEFKKDIFEYGLHHGKCTLCDCLHLAVFMGYKKIVFFGIDLYDTRYFWLKEDETREIAARRGRKCTDVHNTAKYTLSIIEEFKKTFPDIKLLVHNPKSLLADLMPVWSIK